MSSPSPTYPFLPPPQMQISSTQLHLSLNILFLGSFPRVPQGKEVSSTATKTSELTTLRDFLLSIFWILWDLLILHKSMLRENRETISQ